MSNIDMNRTGAWLYSPSIALAKAIPLMGDRPMVVKATTNTQGNEITINENDSRLLNENRTVLSKNRICVVY